MLHCRRKFNFYYWLTVSIILHSGLILPFVFADLHAQDQSEHNKLMIELFGMVADRQMEEKKQESRVITPQKKRAPQKVVARPQEEKASPGQTPDKPETADSPAEQEKADDKQDQTEQAAGSTQVSDASSPAVYVTAGEEAQQRQQSIEYEEDQAADRMREYLAKLAKRIQVNLVYPEKMRKKGIEGIATIAFIITESGDIKEDSVMVQKSSGYAAFDSNALKSALASAPFEKPPKELNVSIGVSFTVEAAQSR